MGRLVAIGIFAVAACGGDTSDTPPDGDGGLVDASATIDAPAGQVCGAAVCTAQACGYTIDDCGDRVACPGCRYTTDLVTASGTSISLPSGNAAFMTYDTTLVVRDANGWSPAPITGAPDAVVDFELAPDGTPWVLTASGGSSSLHAGRLVAGDWVFDQVSASARAGRLAIAPDGTVHVAHITSGTGLVRSTYDGTWTSAVVRPFTTNQSDHVDIAIGGASEPWIAWHDRNAEQLILSTPAGDQIVDPMWRSGDDNQIELAVDSVGRPHVAYRRDWALDRGLMHAVGQNGTWTVVRLFDGEFNDDGDLALATGPTGEVTIVAIQEEWGIQVVDHRDGRYYIQSIGEACDGGSLDAGYADGRLHVARSCSTFGDVVMLQPTAPLVHFPDDHAAACDTIASTLCTAACGCCSSCCFETSACYSPQPNCERYAITQVCADATQDPAIVFACRDGLGAPTCNGSQQAQIPGACAPLW
jgi:hypothetical protein